MSEVGDYLMENYYSKYKGSDMKFLTITQDMVEYALDKHRDRVVVIRDPDIKGVAVYCTLTDKTYKELDNINLKDAEMLEVLLEEKGPNIHFILVCGASVKYILEGIRKVRDRYKAKTVSWWNPTMDYLHKYNMN